MSHVLWTHWLTAIHLSLILCQCLFVFVMSTILSVFGLHFWNLVVVLILTCPFSWLGIISRGDEIKLTLFSSHHFCVTALLLNSGNKFRELNRTVSVHGCCQKAGCWSVTPLWFICYHQERRQRRILPGSIPDKNLRWSSVWAYWSDSLLARPPSLPFSLLSSYLRFFPFSLPPPPITNGLIVSRL